jgi:type IV pilus assembly protein PilM
MASRSIVGLDIGSKFIKAVQLTETNGQYKVTEFGIAEVNPQVSIPDTVMDLFARKRFKTKRVVSSVSGRFVFVRYINMPVMTEEELGNAAKYELGKYIPVEVDEVLHDSQKLEELAAQEGAEPEMRVLLVAAKRTFVDEHVAVLETAGLQPAVVDVDSFALGNAYELSGLINPQAIAAGKLVALADIGASKTTINIMSDSMSYFTREFYKGGDDLTESISKRLSVEAREAETMKRSMAPGVMAGGGPPTPAGPSPIVLVSSEEAERLRETSTRRRPESTGGVPIVILEKGDTMKYRGAAAGSDPNDLHDAVSSVLDDICHDINISIDYFENQYDKKVDEVFITGGTANCAGLQETLERTVQKPVTKWNPVHLLEMELPADSQQEMQDNPSQVAIALGLAARITG